MNDRRCPWRMGSVGAVVLAAAVLAGCGAKAPAPTATPAGPAPEGKQFVLPAAPENAQGVLAVRQTAAGGEEVVVVGRIGGSTQPFVEGMAAFSLVDNSLRACSDIPGDQCPTPWDFCCEADLPKARTLVKVVDESGRIIPTDARALLGVSELQTVYVRGQAQRDADGNLTVLARGVYMLPPGERLPTGEQAHPHEQAHHHGDDAAHGHAPTGGDRHRHPPNHQHDPHAAGPEQEQRPAATHHQSPASAAPPAGTPPAPQTPREPHVP